MNVPVLKNDRPIEAVALEYWHVHTRAEEMPSAMPRWPVLPYYGAPGFVPIVQLVYGATQSGLGYADGPGRMLKSKIGPSADRSFFPLGH